MTTTWRSVKLSKENDFYLYLLRFLLRWHPRGTQHKKNRDWFWRTSLRAIRKKIIVDDISLAIPQQKMTVLVGANGCGKSTLLSTIARLLQPLGGAAILDGKAIHEQPTKAVARKLGILPQSPLLPEGLTVFELVSRGRFPWQNFMRQWSDEDELAVEEALRLTGTAEFAHIPVESLSGGQRQRCWIAMALAQQTPYILLDEPTTFLDLRYQVEILELLHTLTRQHGRTVVVVLHDLNFAVNYGDSLVFLRQGKVEGVLHEAMPARRS